jgi:chromate transporter
VDEPGPDRGAPPPSDRTPAAAPAATADPPTFRQALRFWARLGFVSFGGPTGQIAILHEELVERRRWIGEERFLHALNFCMLLPGPEAQQLATYCGWALHRTAGGLAAGALFVLPSIVILWALSWAYVSFGELPFVAAVFAGLKPAVTAIVVHAVFRIGRRALSGVVAGAIAAAAFVAIAALDVPFPAIVLGAALVGLLVTRAGWWRTARGGPASVAPAAVAASSDSRAGSAPSGAGSGPAPSRAGPASPSSRTESVRASPSGRVNGARGWRRALLVLAVGLGAWWIPVLAAALWQGPGATLTRLGVFFSQAAVVTFGGAYAVLPYVAQRAVEDFGWLSAGQMLDGLGLAETTPGPLIMVLQFVGFLAGWQHPGGLPPLLAATLGALLTTWVTFVPCFLWILLGAPHLEALRGRAPLAGALAGITAAVVGVVVNLAVWFGARALAPGGRPDPFAILVAAAALAALTRLRWSVPAVVGASAAAGLLGWAARGVAA